MSEKSKLVVFDKKEVILVFLIIIITALISFVLGVKIGKDFALATQGINQTDQQSIELESPIEEEARVLKEQKEAQASGKSETVHETTNSEISKRLEDEFNSLDKPKPVEPIEDVSAEDRLKKGLSEVNGADPTAAADGPEQLRAQYVGKYTIQLGSHKNLNEAKEFANGFKVLGYNPIISEVDLKNKGIWFRVSLEAFESVAEAKKYIEQEKSLFQGQDYVISKIE